MMIVIVKPKSSGNDCVKYKLKRSDQRLRRGKNRYKLLAMQETIRMIVINNND